MSSLQCLREFLSGKVNAAAEETHRRIEETIFRYELELDRQHRLLEIWAKPDIQLSNITLPQYYLRGDEGNRDDQEMDPRERREGLEPLKVKEEAGRICISRGEGQLGLKQEAEPLMVTPAHEIQSAEVEINSERLLTDTRDLRELTSTTDKEMDDTHQEETSARSQLNDSDYFVTMGIQSECQSDQPDKAESQSTQNKSSPGVGVISGPHVFPDLSKKECGNMDGLTSPHNEHIKPPTTVEVYACERCDQTFSRKTLLYQHKKTHLRKKRYSCEQCEKRFSKRRLLWKHLKSCKSHLRSDSGENPFVCEICKKGFFGKFPQRKNAKKKPFPCEKCEKRFSDKAKLLKHTKTHEDKKSFTCEPCNKTYRNEADLKRHLANHTQGRRFSCKKCEKDFKSENHLQAHMSCHEERERHLCERCDRAFKSKLGLTIHMRVHKGEKPDSCPPV